MKRAVYIISGIVLLIIAISWGYLTYRQYRSFQTPVPKTATNVLCIRVDALLKDIAWNALWNYKYYRSSQDTDPTAPDRHPWWPSGVGIPANIFLYQLPHTPSDTFAEEVYFGSLPLTDTVAFAAWLHGQSGIKIHQDSTGSITISDRLVVAAKPPHLLFALSPIRPFKNPHRLGGLLDTLLQPGANDPVSKTRFAVFRQLGGHLNILGKYHNSIEFKQGEIRFASRHGQAEGQDIPSDIPDFADSNAASLRYRGPLTALLEGRTFDIGSFTLHGDSLLAHYRGHLTMQWRGTVIQQDTLISYEYDDNFEMTEQQEIVERQVPDIQLSLSTDTGMHNYLQRQAILDEADKSLNRTVFPLFHVGVTPDSQGYLQFHTAPEAASQPSGKDASPQEHLQLHLDFGTLNLHEVAPAVATYLEPFESLTASGRAIGTDNQLINGKLIMKDKQPNSLVNLLLPFLSASAKDNNYE